ncbi:hypothetical protein B0H16DRAFT_1458648 [Mycena metata]|uniref:Uncharacterized protein n=1 Tax=Mycena metata TaxID=1033252 RepID=A0AAD7NCY0_9AGAR|nr:hypothetical protein B0H16DRAFT_1458648 [Mycena metata]
MRPHRVVAARARVVAVPLVPPPPLLVAPTAPTPTPRAVHGLTLRQTVPCPFCNEAEGKLQGDLHAGVALDQLLEHADLVGGEEFHGVLVGKGAEDVDEGRGGDDRVAVFPDGGSGVLEEEVVYGSLIGLRWWKDSGGEGDWSGMVGDIMWVLERLLAEKAVASGMIEGNGEGAREWLKCQPKNKLCTCMFGCIYQCLGYAYRPHAMPEQFQTPTGVMQSSEDRQSRAVAVLWLCWLAAYYNTLDP